MTAIKPIFLAGGLLAFLSAVSLATAAEPVGGDRAQRAFEGQLYRLPPRALLPPLEQALAAEGYRWPEAAPRVRAWQTDWRCRGDRCDRLTVHLTATPAGTRVAIVRTRREGATDSQIRWQTPAGDLERALLRRVDPAAARRVAGDGEGPRD